MSKKKFNSEVELAERVVDYLRDLRWDVYQEVQAYSGNIADIVATQNNLVWIVECKRSFSLDLVAQASEWVNCAHFISIATPSRKRAWSNMKKDKVIKDLLNLYGLGWFVVSPIMSSWESAVDNFFAPKLNRKANVNPIKNMLTERHKTFAKAGNAQGKRYTPFQNTVEQITAIVEQKPGITITELLKSIKHHYSTDSTARCCILKWIQEGVIKGIHLKSEKGRYLIYPDDK